MPHEQAKNRWQKSQSPRVSASFLKYVCFFCWVCLMYFFWPFLAAAVILRLIPLCQAKMFVFYSYRFCRFTCHSLLRCVSFLLFLSFSPCRYSFPWNYKFNGTNQRTSLIRRVNCDIFIIQFQTHEYSGMHIVMLLHSCHPRQSDEIVQHTITIRMMMIMLIIIQSC